MRRSCSILVVTLGLGHGAGAVAHGATRDEGAAEREIVRRLSAQAEELGVWDLAAPSLAVHQLIACESGCDEPGEAPDSLVDRWLLLNLSKEALPGLHRAQLVETLAHHRVPLERTVIFSDLDARSVAELLDAERRAFSLDADPPHGTSEMVYGPELGWLLAALCHYGGPGARVRGEIDVPAVISHLLDNGVNRRLEGGSHELEGLAHCLDAYRSAAAAGPPASAEEVYSRLATFLTAEVRATLESRASSGQLHAGQSEGWSACPEAAPEPCPALADLSKQAHFFDWATLIPGLVETPGLGEAASRLLELMVAVHATTTRDWIEASWKNRYQYAGAVAHALRATRRLLVVRAAQVRGAVPAPSMQATNQTRRVGSEVQ